MVSHCSRRGLTLLEVVLALAILVGSFAVLGQLVTIAINAAKNSRDLTRGQLLAESTMSEITAGILPADNLNAMPVATNPGWSVSAVIQNTPHQGIIQVSVVTQRDNDLRGASQYVLTRWMRDPNIEIPVDEEEADQGGEGGDNSDANPSAGNDASGNNSSTGGNTNPAPSTNNRNSTPTPNRVPTPPNVGGAANRGGGR